MKNPLETLSELEDIIRELHKLDSKMMAGQFILAWRDLRRLLALFESKKAELVREAKKLETNNEKQSP